MASTTPIPNGGLYTSEKLFLRLDTTEFDNHITDIDNNGQIAFVYNGDSSFIYAKGVKVSGVDVSNLELSNYALSTHDHDGKYATSGHNHDGKYATSGHNHDGKYSASGHNHDGKYATSGHTHDEIKTTKEITVSGSAVGGLNVGDTIPAGKTLQEILESILVKVIGAKIGSYPTLTIQYNGNSANQSFEKCSTLDFSKLNYTTANGSFKGLDGNTQTQPTPNNTITPDATWRYSTNNGSTTETWSSLPAGHKLTSKLIIYKDYSYCASSNCAINNLGKNISSVIIPADSSNTDNIIFDIFTYNYYKKFTTDINAGNIDSNKPTNSATGINGYTKTTKAFNTNGLKTVAMNAGDVCLVLFSTSSISSLKVDWHPNNGTAQDWSSNIETLSGTKTIKLADNSTTHPYYVYIIYANKTTKDGFSGSGNLIFKNS